MDFRMRSVMSESTWFGLEPLDLLPEEAVQGAVAGDGDAMEDAQGADELDGGRESMQEGSGLEEYFTLKSTL